VYGIIYKATGPGGKVYVGQTTQTLAKRKIGHKVRAKKQDRRGLFQTALLDEGFDNFTWEQIDQADTSEELDRKEKRWIAHYDSMNSGKGYNVQGGGKRFSHTPEARRKMSEAHKGKHPSEETRRKLSEAQQGNKKCLGRHLSEEHRRKLSEAHKGRRSYVMTAETRRKISEAGKGRPSPMRGKYHTLETRRKMSEAKKGKPNGREGKHLSEETRRRISEAKKTRSSSKPREAQL
jgi:group I intron endonuclease